MSENKEDPKPTSKILEEANALSPITTLKSSTREKLLAQLTSLLTMAFEEGTNTRQNDRIRQKWFTICAYIAQVGARVVTDLEYEKLRSEVNELKRKVETKSVSYPRRAIYTGSSQVSGRVLRKRKP